jgi:hypothetical protein
VSIVRHAARTVAQPPVSAFESAEEAWFWFVRCQQVRREGAQLAGGGMFSRPCDPDDIYRAIMSLRRHGVVGSAHLTVLARFGLIGRPPDRRCADEAQAARLWAEALDRLSTVLRDKGIIY